MESKATIKTASQLVASVITAIELEKEEMHAKCKGFYDALTLMNKGVEPTRGAGGRLHAPCDGYRWIGKDYKAGEFLEDPLGPVDRQLDHYTADPNRGRKIERVSVTLFEGLRSGFAQHGSDVTLGRGREWEDVGGEMICHIYVKSGSKNAFTMIEDFCNSDRSERERAQKALMADAPSGRVIVRGKVLSASYRAGHYGATAKMLIQAHEGFQVWTAIPKALVSSVEYIKALEDRDVAIKVTLEPSPDDPKFARGKRPAVV